jgi:hypothetical protein
MHTLAVDRRNRLALAALGVALLAVAGGFAARRDHAGGAVYSDEKTYENYLASHPAVAVPPGITLMTAAEFAAMRSPSESTPSKSLPPPPEYPVVAISKADITVNGEVVVPVPADASHGVAGRYKRSGGVNDLYITPLASALGAQLAAARSTGHLKAADQGITLLVDARTPSRLFTEVVFTAGQVPCTPILVGVQSNGQLAAIALSPPAPTAAPRASHE